MTSGAARSTVSSRAWLHSTHSSNPSEESEDAVNYAEVLAVGKSGTGLAIKHIWLNCQAAIHSTAVPDGRDAAVRNRHTDELHVAKLFAVERKVVTFSKWPLTNLRFY